jgi:hypothetical protein
MEIKAETAQVSAATCLFVLNKRTTLWEPQDVSGGLHSVALPLSVESAAPDDYA